MDEMKMISKHSVLRFVRPLVLSLAVAGVVAQPSTLSSTRAIAQPYQVTLGAQRAHLAGLRVPTTSTLTIVASPAAKALSASAGIPTTPIVAAAKVYMLELINADRARNHLVAMSSAPLIDTVAQQRSQDMIARHYFSHQIPGGGMVFDVLDRQHVNYQMAGENLALNNYIKFYSIQKTIDHTNVDLMNSPEHRANLLQPSYSQVGIGIAFDSTTGHMILTEVFLQP